MFCSWGAEEYGLIGSYEWVEQHAKVLSQRAVAYLNVDIAVEGIISYIVDVDIIAGATILYLVLTSIFFCCISHVFLRSKRKLFAVGIRCSVDEQSLFGEFQKDCQSKYCRSE